MMQASFVRRLRTGVCFAFSLLSLASAGCSSLLSSVTNGFASDLSASILNSTDVETVRQGAPAYLLLIDGLIGEDSRDANLLSQAAALNSAYAGAFVEDPVRQKALSSKALKLALRASCAGLKDGCDLRTRDYDSFERWLKTLRKKDVPLAFSVAGSWAGWMQAHSDELGAIAELGRLKALVERLVALDPTYDNSSPRLYLAVLESLQPAAVGGRPDIARGHFEQVIEDTAGRNLMAKVFFAELYGRGTFDRETHDRLLEEVIEADAEAPGLTLMNTLAKSQALELLESADDYF
ncbi:MAG: TRAP transporter TatT component family protein [Pseudomonadota bacterium]